MYICNLKDDIEISFPITIKDPYTVSKIFALSVYQV